MRSRGQSLTTYLFMDGGKDLKLNAKEFAAIQFWSSVDLPISVRRSGARLFRCRLCQCVQSTNYNTSKLTQRTATMMMMTMTLLWAAGNISGCGWMS